MDACRLDSLLHFSLAAAGQEDPPYRALGPIHLIKYAYLADLAYAEQHGGQTYTGAPWRFFNFGPWAEPVYDRIEPAVRAIGAERRVFDRARYEGEFVRYTLEDDEAYERLSRQLPIEAVTAIKRAVHEFGNDTYGLLNHVYLTRPMLEAAPGEPLVFREEPAEPPVPQEDAPVDAPLTRRARKEREAAIARLRLDVRARLAQRRARVRVVPAPRYDEVFRSGTEWLDSLAGEAVPATRAEATFSDDIWRSPTRGGTEVP